MSKIYGIYTKRIDRALIISFLVFCFFSTPQFLFSQIAKGFEPQDFEIELNTPEIPFKRVKRVQEKMQQIAQSLIDDGFNVELMRADQVIVVTISIGSLFAPNSCELSDDVNKYLQPFVRFIRQPGEYKLLLCVHTDNTGSESYRKWICEQRILSLYDYYDTHGASSMVYGYPMGCSQPLGPDDSVNNRALNRRLEIYIIPEVDFINNR